MRRRGLLAALAALPVVAVFAARAAPAVPGIGSPRLQARPQDVSRSLAPGLRRVAAGGTKMKFYVPPTAAAHERAPLVVFLHGALRTVDPFVYAHRNVADATGTCLLAPFSSKRTWDALTLDYGPDIQGLDDALGWMFEHYPIDPARIALSGFSDGATYALAVGRANGGLFRTVIAYSPGGLLPVLPVGNPQLVVTHGRADPVLPFRTTNEVIVPWLQAHGYDVRFEPFEGGHVMPRQVMEREVKRLADPGALASIAGQPLLGPCMKSP